MYFKLHIFNFKNDLIVELFAFIEVIDEKILKSLCEIIKLNVFDVESIKNSKIEFDEKFSLFSLITIKLFDCYKMF